MKNKRKTLIPLLFIILIVSLYTKREERRAFQKTGKQVVVLIDEYDAPLLDVLHDDQMLANKRQVMQEFYVPLKANEQ